MHPLLYHPKAIKKLKKIHPNDRKRILDRLEEMAKVWPKTSSDVKKLVNTKQSYRLRSGDVRAIFEVTGGKNYVWDIDYRGSIY